MLRAMDTLATEEQKNAAVTEYLNSVKRINLVDAAAHERVIDDKECRSEIFVAPVSRTSSRASCRRKMYTSDCTIFR